MRRLFRNLSLFLLVLHAFQSACGKSDIYAASSLLASGKWYKIAIVEEGIYRISYDMLKTIGLADPSNPRIYGNNTGQLSYFNDGTAADDLKEIAVYFSTGSDRIFNEGDFLLFYSQATGRWVYNQDSREFNYLKHNYSDTAFYFVTSGNRPGRRIMDYVPPADPANYYSESSDALFIHEKETENILHSGREWYQPVSYNKAITINPGFSNLITAEKVRYEMRVMSRASISTTFSLSENKSVIISLTAGPVDPASTTGTWAQVAEATGESLPVSSSPVYEIAFGNNGETTARGWIDYLMVHGRKYNSFDGSTEIYTDARSVGMDFITEFTIESSDGDPLLWDVTDPFSVHEIKYSKSGNKITFKASTDTLRTYVAFTPGKAKGVVFRSKPVKNQDLHASEPADMLIVTFPAFRAQAERLAEFHSINSGLSSLVVTPEEIYNEFSGGIPDISAIRNFVRMKYLKQKGTSLPLKYLLLFGDGSFDNNTSPPGNTNYIPTWQSENSSIVISSFTSDDFYGLLDDGEGEDSGTEDIGIGRLPVSDTSQASAVVSKIMNYLSPANQGSWKNIVCLIADDEDGNTHMADAEGLAETISENAPWVNTVRIYFDAYKQETSPTGQFYPEVTEAINDRVNSGALVVNFTGHGNESGLGHERVVTTETIGQWKNDSRLPVFITATCEFSRFDDININSITGDISAKNSAGEKILLDPSGGGIALMSTTRLVYSAPNYTLNREIFEAAFGRDEEGGALRLGDIIRIAKNRSGNNINKRNFILLGDPSVRLAWPWHGNIVTDSINDIQSGKATDTLKALSMIKITGHLEDHTGTPLTGFNGTITPVVYGQPSEIQTLGNDGGQKMKFHQQDNILFTGKVAAADGKFSFTFLVPRDIDYNYGNGKISYYACDEAEDMNGHLSDLVVGGFSNIVRADTSGPKISLFLNDTLFRDGGLADGNPKLFAIVEDEGGINIAGTGIGHDLTCWADNDRTRTWVLNDYYESDQGSYCKGRIVYGLSGFSPGFHTITVKAWDNFNNSSEQSISFLAISDEKLVLKNLMNYPNPFINLTRISAEHNKPGTDFNITIYIFNINGQIIREFRQPIHTEGYRLPPVEWDGTDEAGGKVGKGIYIYRVKVTSSTGETTSASGRMIIY